MHLLVDKLLCIADTCSLQKIDDWETFQFDGKELMFFNNITYKIFEILIRGKGTHLSRWELQEVLDIEDTEILDRLFKLLNQNSKNISYEEFHDFLARASKDDINTIMEVMGLKKINDENLENVDLNDVVDELIDEIIKDTIEDKLEEENEETELDYNDNKNEENVSQIRRFLNRVLSIFN